MTGRIPGPKGRLLIGNTIEFQEQPLDFILKYKAQYGDLYRFTVAGNSWYLVSRPEWIDRILVREAANFYKPKLAKRLWRPFLGEGVLAADGEKWKKQSKLVRPGFHRERIDAYGRIMVHFTHQLIEGWQDGDKVDMVEEMTSLTLWIVCKTLFDADVTGDAARVGELMVTLNDKMLEHINLPLPVPRWWPSRTNREKVAALDEIRAVVRRIIDERRTSGEDRGDLLSMLALAKDEQGVPMGDEQLHAETMTLFFAGHETTSLALAWMWYLLAKHPQVLQALVDEVDTVLGGRAPEVSDLSSLPYLELVVKESMRILPSVWSFMREPQTDVTFGEFQVPKGSILFISPYAVHHDARWYPDPEVFRPERFTADNYRTIPKGAYIPFAGGPRICLGKQFAMMESRLVLATLVQHVRPSLHPDYRHELHPQLALRPKHGMPITVTFRERRAAALAEANR